MCSFLWDHRPNVPTSPIFASTTSPDGPGVALLTAFPGSRFSFHPTFTDDD